MDEPGFLRTARVAIVGLGLMGGSLALALRGQCASLLGVERDAQTLELARRMRLADQLSPHAADLLPQADVIVLATPVRTILNLLAELPALHPGPAVVLDLGSTKGKILEAMRGLPERFDPLGGHPMCGKERSTLENAEAGLFQAAAFALCPLERTTPRARALAEALALAVGARPLWLDAHTHDRWTAAASHLPYLTANALAAVTPLEARPLVGPGFRSTARLAPSPLGMMADILATNQENLLTGLQALRRQLEAIETCLACGDEKGLGALLSQGAAHYESLVE